MLSDALLRLCRAYRIQPSFHDSFGQLQTSPEESILRILRCLGAKLDSSQDVESAFSARRAQLYERVWEPVHVHWSDCHPSETPGDAAQSSPPVALKLSPPLNAKSYRLELKLESGATRVFEGSFSDCVPSEAPPQLAKLLGQQAGGRPWVDIVLTDVTELGVHSLHLELIGRNSAKLQAEESQHTSVLMLAPQRAWANPCAADWGVFAPTYALRGAKKQAAAGDVSSRGLGFGDIGHLSDLVDWVGEQGGQAVATLPLLAQFLDEIFEPSPYSPASRLFWNEFYLNLDALPEFAECSAAQRLLKDPEFVREMAKVQAAPCVDYRACVAVKRLLLEHLSQSFFESGGDKSPQFEEFVTNSRVRHYAEFRATGETLRAPWQQWPDWAQPRGQLDSHYRSENYRYHLYCQYRLAQQMEQLGSKARKLGLGLYLDLPVGVHGSGYDLWAEPDVFLLDCAAGAPPDICFTGGQDWGTAPLSPEGLRRQGYRYLRDVLSHHLRAAGALRIDHVMGIQRIYCVPKGMDASAGVYVGYEMEEILALLTLESVKHGSVLVGEDLGTVSAELPEALERHGIRRMHVLEYAMAGDHVNFESLTDNAVACINTHDLFPFAAWCDGEDLCQRWTTGGVDEHQFRDEKHRRDQVLNELTGQFCAEGSLADSSLSFPLSQTSYQSLLAATLNTYGASCSPLVLVNLEDLWAERLPQNIPGTSTEACNWQRRLRHSTSELSAFQDLTGMLTRLAELRAKAPRKRAPRDLY